MKNFIFLSVLTTTTILAQTATAASSSYECRGENGTHGRLSLSPVSRGYRYVEGGCADGYYGEKTCDPGYYTSGWDERKASLKLMDGSSTHEFHFTLFHSDSEHQFRGVVSEATQQNPLQITISSDEDQSLYTLEFTNTRSRVEEKPVLCKREKLTSP